MNNRHLSTDQNNRHYHCGHDCETLTGYLRNISQPVDRCAAAESVDLCFVPGAERCSIDVWINVYTKPIMLETSKTHTQLLLLCFSLTELFTF